MKTWLEEQSGVSGQHSASLLVSRVVTAAVRAVRPGPVAAPVLFELGPVRALWLLVRGRAATERPSDVIMSYAAGRGGVHLMIGVVGVIELLAVHLILPWHPLSWPYEYRSTGSRTCHRNGEGSAPRATDGGACDR